jgi:membrane-bound metal-dependent hydrolase YbcI (DUF457 family)
MLPPGHLAAGYLTAKALLYFGHQNFTELQQSALIGWGLIFGVAPDLDMLYSFAKQKGYRVIGDDLPQHRKYISHAPILWLIAGLVIYFFAGNIYHKYIGLLLWFGSWSHFILDSFDYGIMWLWPLSNKVYSLRNREKNFGPIDGPKNVISYFIGFLKQYRKVITFYLEIIIIISAIIIRFK